MTRDRYGRRRQTVSCQWDGYESLIAGIEATTTAAGEGAPQDEASSPLAHLLRALEAAWTELTGGGSPEEFAIWLEQTAVVGADEETGSAHSYLDSLDTFLIAAIQEVEEFHHAALTPNQIEAELTAIWLRTYAFAAAQEEARLAQIWLARGRAIKTQYPDGGQRRRIYRTSLSPRSATRAFDLVEAVRARLQDGAGYARWAPEQRFTFIRDVLALLAHVPSFRIATTLGRRKNFEDWPRLLRWWLVKATLPVQPTPREITSWYDFVAQNFIYRGTWGLGSIITMPEVRSFQTADRRIYEFDDPEGKSDFRNRSVRLSRCRIIPRRRRQACARSQYPRPRPPFARPHLTVSPLDLLEFGSVRTLRLLDWLRATDNRGDLRAGDCQADVFKKLQRKKRN